MDANEDKPWWEKEDEPWWKTVGTILWAILLYLLFKNQDWFIELWKG